MGLEIGPDVVDVVVRDPVQPEKRQKLVDKLVDGITAVAYEREPVEVVTETAPPLIIFRIFFHQNNYIRFGAHSEQKSSPILREEVHVLKFNGLCASCSDHPAVLRLDKAGQILATAVTVGLAVALSLKNLVLWKWRNKGKHGREYRTHLSRKPDKNRSTGSRITVNGRHSDIIAGAVRLRFFAANCSISWLINVFSSPQNL